MAEPDKVKILFLCVGNSCRSQMAEGWAEHLRGDTIDAYSAGVMPSRVSGRAIEVMAEAGVDISSHYSKHVDDFVGIDFDYVITLCDSAKQQCPVFGESAKIIHKSFDDPSFNTASNEKVEAEFRRVRDEIKAFVETLPL